MPIVILTIVQILLTAKEDIESWADSQIKTDIQYVCLQTGIR